MTKKTRFKIGIILVVICMMSFSDCSFAENSESVFEGITTITSLLYYIVSLLSWLRIIFAKLAGEFLTNNRVYGETLGIDSLLWMYRNIVKNIANFCLGFYFLFVIFKSLIKGEIEKNIKKILMWILVAGVGIQASRFIVAAVVDVSTITLVAAGSLPSQMIANNQNLSDSVQNAVKQRFVKGLEDSGIQSKKRIIPFSTDEAQWGLVKVEDVPLATGENIKTIVDNLMPKADSIDGPLYYLGFAILETDNVPSFKKLNEATEDGMKSTLFNLLISGGTTIVYALEMVVLCVVAFLRLLYMWMFIVLSPLAILLFCMKKSGTEIKGLKNITDTINIKSFLVNAFKPTIIVLGIGLALMFATLMRGVITDSAGVKDKVSIGGIEFSTNQDANNNTEDKPGYQTQISRAGFSVTLKHVGKTFMELILSIITVILVYLIIKIAVNMGDTKDFVTKKTKKLQKELGTTLTQLPIVPVPGNSEKGIPTKYTSFEQVRNLPGTLLSNIEYQQKSKMDDQATAVMDIRGVNDVGGGLPKVKTEIHKIITNPSTPGLKQLYNAKQKMMKLNNAGFVLGENAPDPYRQNEFEGWLETAKQENIVEINGVVSSLDATIWRNMVKWWQDSENDNNKTLGDLFTRVNGSAKTYATFFGLDNVETRNSLANKDITKKKK